MRLAGTVAAQLAPVDAVPVNSHIPVAGTAADGAACCLGAWCERKSVNHKDHHCHEQAAQRAFH
jgi:hypothetical protein